jgi:hypothetical protein
MLGQIAAVTLVAMSVLPCHFPVTSSQGNAQNNTLQGIEKVAFERSKTAGIFSRIVESLSMVRSLLVGSAAL